MDRTVITASQAPKAIGPYSHAVRSGDFIFSSGQIGLDPTTQSLVPGGVEAETRQVLTNLKHVLAEAGSGLEAVVKTTVFLRSMDDFPSMNAIYAEFFPKDPPARSTVAVAGLPRNAAVEIEVIARAK